MSISFTQCRSTSHEKWKGKKFKITVVFNNWGADQIRVFVVFQFSLTLLLVSISFIDKQACFILLEFAILLKLFSIVIYNVQIG